MRRFIVLALLAGGSAWATQCTALNAFANSGTDAGPTLNTCINTTIGPGGTIDVLPGVYLINTQVPLNGAIIIRTNGKTSTDPACDYNGDATCAEFKRGMSLNATGGMFLSSSNPGAVAMRWIILNGDKANTQSGPAATSCTTVSTFYGLNAQFWFGPSVEFSKSVAKNAVCSGGLWIWADTINVTDSAFVFNGTHGNGLHSDGLTNVQSINPSTWLRNTFVDNTDVDVIWGGSPNSTIQYNTITHTAGAWGKSAFGCLMIHGWSFTSGDYTGTDFSHNTIDGGANLNCGGGLILGANAWYNGPTFAGTIHDNFITRSQIGFTVDGAGSGTWLIGSPTAVAIYDNAVEDNGTTTGCNSGGTHSTQAYELSGSNTLTRTSDTVPTAWYAGSYPITEGCIPNGSNTSQTAYSSNFTGTPSVSVTGTTATVTWTSGSGKTSEVLYGITTAYGSTSGIQQYNGTSGVTSHSITLTGLASGTTYHYKAKQKSYPYGYTDYDVDRTFTTTGIVPSTTLRGVVTLRGTVTVR